MCDSHELNGVRVLTVAAAAHKEITFPIIMKEERTKESGWIAPNTCG